MPDFEYTLPEAMKDAPDLKSRSMTADQEAMHNAITKLFDDDLPIVTAGHIRILAETCLEQEGEMFSANVFFENLKRTVARLKHLYEQERYITFEIVRRVKPQ